MESTSPDSKKTCLRSKPNGFLSMKLKRLLREYKRNRLNNHEDCEEDVSQEGVTFFPGSQKKPEEGKRTELLTPNLNCGVRRGLGETLNDEDFKGVIGERTTYITQVDTPSGDSRFAINHVDENWTLAQEIQRIMEAFVKSPLEEPIEMITVGISMVNINDLAKAQKGKSVKRLQLGEIGFKPDNLKKLTEIELSDFSPLQIGSLRGARRPEGETTTLKLEDYWYELVMRMFEGQADPNLLDSTACFYTCGARKKPQELMGTPLEMILEYHFETRNRLLMGQVLPVLVLGLHSPSKLVSKGKRLKHIEKELTNGGKPNTFFPGTSSDYAMDLEFQERWKVNQS